MPSMHPWIDIDSWKVRTYSTMGSSPPVQTILKTFQRTLISFGRSSSWKHFVANVPMLAHFLCRVRKPPKQRCCTGAVSWFMILIGLLCGSGLPKLRLQSDRDCEGLPQALGIKSCNLRRRIVFTVRSVETLGSKKAEHARRLVSPVFCGDPRERLPQSGLDLKIRATCITESAWVSGRINHVETKHREAGFLGRQIPNSWLASLYWK